MRTSNKVIVPKKTSTIINFDFNNSKMRYSYNITDMSFKLPNIDLNSKLMKLEKAKMARTRNQFNKTMQSIDFVNPRDKKRGPRIKIPSETRSDSSETARRKRQKSIKASQKKKINPEYALKRKLAIHEHNGRQCDFTHGKVNQRPTNRHVHGHDDDHDVHQIINDALIHNITHSSIDTDSEDRN